MEILLLVILGCILLALAVRAWRSYESELRKTFGAPNVSVSFDALPFEDFSSSNTSHIQSAHHGDFGCADAHHSACDGGGHGGFDAGHVGFDGGGHH
jgi:hypothetical protein